jgi:hypothetical protein
MSIYPQQAYSQPPTFPHAYPPQPPSYALPSSPVYPVDPGSFRNDYTARLAGLTDNSRVIIQGLSMYAHDFSRWGDVVTQCIEIHIRRVSDSLLSTFYSPRSTPIRVMGIDGMAILSRNLFVTRHVFVSVVAPHYKRIRVQKKNCFSRCRLAAVVRRVGDHELVSLTPRLFAPVADSSFVSFSGSSGDEASGLLPHRRIIEKCVRALCWSFRVYRGASVSGILSAG